MDLIEALDTLEAERHAVEAYHEMLADLGSSYFYGGAQGNNGYDALSLARNELGPMPAVDGPEVREARATVAYYESIRPMRNDIPPHIEDEAERRADYAANGDGLDAPDGWYR